MSGLEVVGLVLAVVPLILGTLDKYEGGREFFTDWFKFQREFTKFSNNLRSQQILLRQLTETALRWVVDSESDIRALLNNPKSPRWKDALLTERLELKLCGEGEYMAFCNGINAIHKQLQGIEKYVEVSKELTPTPDAKSPSEFKKLQFCLRHKKLSERVGKISQETDTLSKILHNAKTLEVSRHSSSHNAVVKIFERVRRQATSLHDAITRAWTCECRRHHSFKLMLSRSDRRAAKTAEPRSIRADQERKFRVALPFGAVTDMQASASRYNDRWCTVETSVLLEPQSGHQTQSITRATPLLCPSSNLRSQRYSVSSTHSHHTALSSTATQSSRQTALTTPDSYQVISDLCHILKHRAEIESDLGFLYDGSDLYHALKIVTRNFTPECVSHIVSLGQILSKDSRLPPSVDLQLSRAARLSIVLIIAQALLELCPGPCLPDAWDKNNIFFFVDATGTIMWEHPFLVCDNTRSKSGAAAKADHSGALLSLGILILEMWFNKPLESQPAWKANFGPDGKETEFTKFSAAVKWQKKIGDDGGLVLDCITQRCIYGNFGLATKDLGDHGLVKAVYEGVVRELEVLLEGFCKD